MTEKRVVFVHPDGLHQILGTTAGFERLPVTAENFQTRGRVVPFASLVRVTSRAAYYREPIIPGPYTFHGGTTMTRRLPPAWARAKASRIQQVRAQLNPEHPRDRARIESLDRALQHLEDATQSGDYDRYREET